MVEIRKQADEVKAARLAKQQEVASWVIAEPDDYVEKKAPAGKKRKKAKAAADGSADEGDAHSSGADEEVERPKKKKTKPKKKYVDPDDESDQAMASDGDDGERKPKPKPKKKVRRPTISPRGLRSLRLCRILTPTRAFPLRSGPRPQEGDP